MSGDVPMRVALHACCGPCLLEPYDDLASDHDVLVVYANPNIRPAEEYGRRLAALREHADRTGVEVVELPYEPFQWDRATEGTEDRPAGRCRACYELRLSLVAGFARDLGCEGLATTLSVSPYQDAAAIDEVGRRIADSAGLQWLGTDWRPRYPEATRRSRELGMYRQNYCGCLPSRDEAERSRAERRTR